ncbi:hypothetical protein [Bauldia sp.]|uniref:hypothetical protein n=1 Tax=Bauldia sp. TaxID=2575872 RepID=UPI003BA93E14
MKTTALTLAAAIALAATANTTVPASAEDIDLTGKWKVVSGTIRTSSGETLIIGETSTTEFVFTDHVGPVFSGNYSWEHHEEMQDLHDGEAVTHRSQEDFVGIIHPDGKTFTIADHPDTGLAVGMIVNANRIELIGFEAGPHAYTSHSVLVRE